MFVPNHTEDDGGDTLLPVSSAKPAPWKVGGWSHPCGPRWRVQGPVGVPPQGSQSPTAPKWREPPGFRLVCPLATRGTVTVPQPSFTEKKGFSTSFGSVRNSGLYERSLLIKIKVAILRGSCTILRAFLT